MEKNPYPIYRTAFITGILAIVCDQLSKWAVQLWIPLQTYYAYLGDRVILTHVTNTGGILGIGQELSPLGKIIWLQLLPIGVLLAFLIRLHKRRPAGTLRIVAYGLIFGGGIGNLIDRVLHGSVVDFIQLHIGSFRSTIFNLADVSVCLGILLVVWSWRRQKNTV